MDQTLDFIKIIQDVVLNPNLGSALILFFLSLVNEIVAVIPYALVLSGQLLFLEDSLNIAMLTKLLVFVAVPVGVGSAIGSLPVYVLAYFGGKPLIEKYHKYLHFSWRDVEKMGAHFKGEWYDEIIFLILRSVPILPSFPISIAVGILRMRFLPYMVLTTVGFIIRMMLTLLIVGVGVETLSRFLIFLYTN